MANVYGFSTFGSNSGNNVLPNGNKNIYSTNDLYITTISDKKISINSNKTNVNEDDGDVLFNDNTTGADVVVKSGDLVVDTGDILSNNVYASDDFVGNGNITTPCVVTSTEDFDPGATTTYYTNICNVSSPDNDRVTHFYYEPSFNTVYNVQDPTGSHVFTVQIQTPANTSGEVIVTIPIVYNMNFSFVGSPVSGGVNSLNTLVSVAPSLTNETNPTYLNGTWYALNAINALSLGKETSFGSGIYNQYYSSNFLQIVNPNIPIGASTTVSVNSGSAQVTALNDGTYTFAQNIGYFNYRFYVSNEATATNYELKIGLNTSVTFSTYQGVTGAYHYPQIYQAIHTYDNTTPPFQYTLTDNQVVIPTNTSVGTTMVANLCFKNAIPLFTTGWLVVSKNSQYQIVHNLNTNTARPFRVQILFSTTNDGSYPVTDISSQGYGRGNANLCGAYLYTQSDPNTILLASGAYSVGVSVQAGSGTSMYINNEDGYWNVFIY